MVSRTTKEARYYELIKEGKSPTEALLQSDREFGEGYSESKESPKYQKEFRAKKADKEFVKPRVFSSIEEAEEYLASLPPKERFEQEARLKGFKSGEERRKAIEFVNRQMLMKADIEAAKRRYGTPEKVYEETKEQLISGAKGLAKGIKTRTSQAAGIEDRSKLLEDIKEGLKHIGATAAGNIILKLKGLEPGDIRSLKHIREQIRKEELKASREKAEQRRHELEVAKAIGGHPTYKARPRPRPTAGKVFLGGLGFGAGGFTTARRTTPVRIQPKRIVRTEQRVVSVDNPFGLNAGGIAQPRIEHRPIKRQISVPKKVVIEQRKFVRQPERIISRNPVSDTSANFLVDMGGISPITKRKKISYNDPTGAGAYWK